MGTIAYRSNQRPWWRRSFSVHDKKTCDRNPVLFALPDFKLALSARRAWSSAEQLSIYSVVSLLCGDGDAFCFQKYKWKPPPLRSFSAILIHWKIPNSFCRALHITLRRAFEGTHEDKSSSPQSKHGWKTDADCNDWGCDDCELSIVKICILSRTLISAKDRTCGHHAKFRIHIN